MTFQGLPAEMPPKFINQIPNLTLQPGIEAVIDVEVDAWPPAKLVCLKSYRAESCHHLKKIVRNHDFCLSSLLTLHEFWVSSPGNVASQLNFLKK